MNGYYEYILAQQNQLVKWSHRANYLRSCQEQHHGAWVRIIGRFGDVLISCGAWMKRVSSSPIDDNSVGIYSQN